MTNWRQSWRVAITRPSVNTFTALANDPKANAWRPTVWVIFSGLLAGLLAIGADYLVHQATYRGMSATQLLQLNAPFLFVWIIASFLGFVIVVAIQHLIAHRLGGSGTFGQQAYVVGAIMAPLLLLATVVGSLPIIGVITPILLLFGLLVDVIALKAVYRFNWLKALLSSFLILLVLILVILIIALILLGPTIGNIFSNVSSVPGLR